MAHHGIEEQRTLRDLLPDVPVLGLTATPELTTDTIRFNDMYKRTVEPSRTLQDPFSGTIQEWLIKTGVLSQFKIEEKSIAQEASESIGSIMWTSTKGGGSRWRLQHHL